MCTSQMRSQDAIASYTISAAIRSTYVEADAHTKHVNAAPKMWGVAADISSAKAHPPLCRIFVEAVHNHGALIGLEAGVNAI
jgi:hypothetical protein